MRRPLNSDHYAQHLHKILHATRRALMAAREAGRTPPARRPLAQTGAAFNHLIK